MLLSQKHFFRLRKELSAKVASDVTAKRYCQNANVPVLKIRFNLSPWEWWEDILAIALGKQDTAIALLKAALKDDAENEVYNFYHDEILSSRQLRLKKLAEAFKKGKCVVFLGPDILQVRNNNTTNSFNDIMCRELEETMKNAFIYYDANLADNISYLAQCYADDPKSAPGEVAAIAADYYKTYLGQGLIDDAVYNELAKLPLRLIINANPDDLLCTKLNAINNNSCRLKVYDISNSALSGTTEAGASASAGNGNSAAVPKVLQYNIFGIFTHENSILYTESQFLNFINSVILGNPRLDPDVLRELEDQENYFFLGFDFEQWYFKILFQLFKIKKVQYASISCGVDQSAQRADNLSEKSSISIYNREFFEQEFKMFFVNDDIRSFLSDLKNLLQGNNP